MLRKWLILTHRYLGIALSIVFVVWFISGIAMIYARGMPALTPPMRLDRLAPLAFDEVTFSPAEAAARVDLGSAPAATLLTVLGRPAYRLGPPPGVTVFADTGERMDEVDARSALSAAALFQNVPEERLSYSGTLEGADQWTIGVRRQTPLHHFRVDDAARSHLYVAAATGEVVVLTTRGSRLLAWVAAIPHWFYFAPLRLNDTLWRQTVLWTAAIGSLLALGGVILGVIQLRFRQPSRREGFWRFLPYSGLMRWHHGAGLVFGVVTLTWVFSGYLSMDPFAWTNRGQGAATAAGQVFNLRAGNLADFPVPDGRVRAALEQTGEVREVQFVRLQGEPHLLVRRRSDIAPTYYRAADLHPRLEAFDTTSLLARLRGELPATGIAETAILTSYDAYHYARGGAYAGRGPSLPVLRVKLSDVDRTWLYVDPMTGQLERSVNRLERVERWLYNGLHSLDFAFWYDRRPWWDLGVVVLSLGGLTLSGIGVVLGLKRIRRYVRRLI